MHTKKRYKKIKYTEKKQIKRRDIHKDKTNSRSRHSPRGGIYGKKPDYKEKIYMEKKI